MIARLVSLCGIERVRWVSWNLYETEPQTNPVSWPGLVLETQKISFKFCPMLYSLWVTEKTYCTSEQSSKICGHKKNTTFSIKNLTKFFLQGKEIMHINFVLSGKYYPENTIWKILSWQYYLENTIRKILSGKYYPDNTILIIYPDNTILIILSW